MSSSAAGSSSARQLKAGFPLAARLDTELLGQRVWVVSAERGIAVGISQGLEGASICIDVGPSTTRLIGASIITFAALLTYIPASGDASSHGATWPNLLRTLEELRDADSYTAESYLDVLRGMFVEASREGDAAWVILCQQFKVVTQSDMRFLRFSPELLGLIAFAMAQVDLEEDDFQKFMAGLTAELNE